MSEQTRMSRRELFTGWRKRLTETEAASGESAQEISEKQTKSLAREKAFELLDTGGLDEAIDAFRSYVRQELNDDEARMALGSCLYEKGQLVQAKVEFERVLRIRKNDSLASLYLTLVLLRLQKFEKAMKTLAAIENNAEDPVSGALISVRTTLDSQGSTAMPAAVSDLESYLMAASPELA